MSGTYPVEVLCYRRFIDMFWCVLVRSWGFWSALLGFARFSLGLVLISWVFVSTL